MSDLVHWRLMRPVRGTRGAYEAVDPRWANLAHEALAERPDLPLLLDTASAMAALAALPGTPSAREASGLSPPTWRATVRRLHESNLIAQLHGVYTLQSRLPALERLITAYRDLQVTFDDDWAQPANPTAPVTVLPLHQRGTEAAWRLRNAGDIQLQSLDWSQAPFSTLQPTYNIAYHGPRSPDALDWALWMVCAECDLDYRVELASVERIDPRVAAVVAAGFTASGIQRRGVQERFDAYGLVVFYHELRRLFNRPGGAAWKFRQQYLDEFGIEEGLLEP